MKIKLFTRELVLDGTNGLGFQAFKPEPDKEFETMDHANVTSTAILGYMVGTYEQPTIDITIGGNEANNTLTLVAKYVSDSNLSEPFNRVCESFESYSKGCSEAQVMIDDEALGLSERF